MSQKRLLQEYKRIKQTLKDRSDVIVSLESETDEDLTHWNAVINGPPNTPYAKHTFKLDISLPEEYPLVPPNVKFQSYAMPHCNVNFETGEICLNILDAEGWSPVWDLMNVLVAIYQLLGDPVTDSPLNIDIANILRVQDTGAYYGLIRYYLETD